MHRLISEHPLVHSIAKESFLFTATSEQRAAQISAWQTDALKNGKKIVEKTPWHLFFIEEFSTMVPDAKFVGMIRDDSDVVRCGGKVRSFKAY